MASDAIVKNSKSRFGEKLARLFNNPDFADVTIAVGDVKVSAHRTVLSLQSEYFEKALSESFAEGATGVLQCPAQKGQAYLRVLQFLYTGDYAEEPSKLISDEDDHELLRDPRVYFLADSYLLTDLMSVALDKFRIKLEHLWVSERFVDCIEEIYANTPSGSKDGLRAEVIEVCVLHIKQMLSRQKFLLAMEAGGDFVVELVEKLARASSENFDDDDDDDE